MASMAPRAALLWSVLLLLLLLGLSVPVLGVVGSIVCIPNTMSVIENNEGRHSCAYDSKLGYRAVGVGYNLDDRSEERKREVSSIFTDYDKVYEGKTCLNDIQMNTLLTFDARRNLLKAGEHIKTFEDWCCNVQSAFADIAFRHGEKQLGKDLDETIKEAANKDWDKAADNLRATKWCQEHSKSCAYDAGLLKQGCPDSVLQDPIIF